MPVWLVHTYQWLETNNLWKSAIAFAVTVSLGAVLGACLRPWKAFKRHRDIQRKIADRLDTGTPGGLTDLVNAVNKLAARQQDDSDDDDDPDDNGSDPRAGGHHGYSPMPGGHGGVYGASHR